MGAAKSKYNEESAAEYYVESCVREDAEQVNCSIMAAFNRFDAGFKAQRGNCHIAPPPLAGRLHKTYILTDAIRGTKYVVQRLSLAPFDLRAVDHMFQLMEIAQECAASKGAFEKGGILEGWTRIKYFNIGGVKTRKILYEYDGQGNPFTAWRVMEFVEGRIYDKLADIGESEIDVQRKRQTQLKAAKMLGESIAVFIILMNFMPEGAQLMDTLPGFHDTAGYVGEVSDLLAGKKVRIRPGGKTAHMAKMVDGLLDGRYQNGKYSARVNRMIELFQNASSLADALKGLPVNLQRAIAHGDLKINNVVWATDEMGNPEHVKCFIDLDTIGSYTALDDFGDASRSMINVLGEDIWREGNTLDEIVLDGEVLEKIVEGYLKGIRNLLNTVQSRQVSKVDQSSHRELRVYLYRSVAVYFFQLGTRFLKAFISELTECVDIDNARHFVYFVRRTGEDLEDRNLRLAEVQYTALIKFLRAYRDELRLDELRIEPNDLPEPIGW